MTTSSEAAMDAETFLDALGINPAMVTAETMSIELINSGGVIRTVVKWNGFRYVDSEELDTAMFKARKVYEQKAAAKQAERQQERRLGGPLGRPLANDEGTYQP